MNMLNNVNSMLNLYNQLFPDTKQSGPSEVAKGPSSLADVFQPAPSLNFEKNADKERFSGFKENNHIILFGPSNTGKTTYVITQLCEGWFNFDFKKFIYAGPEVNKAQINNIFMGAKVDLTINKDNPIDDKNVYHYYYEIAEDMVKLESILRNRQSDKTLIFFDDIQASPFQNKLANTLIQAKNANVTCIVTLHSNQQTPVTKAARDNCNYYVFFRPTENTINVLTKTTNAKELINRLSILRAEEQILIYQKIGNEFYYGTGKKQKVISHQLPPFTPPSQENEHQTSGPQTTQSSIPGPSTSSAKPL